MKGGRREPTRKSQGSFSLSEAQRGFLLRATAPLRVTGQLANKLQHKTPSKLRGRVEEGGGGGGRCQSWDSADGA